MQTLMSILVKFHAMLVGKRWISVINGILAIGAFVFHWTATDIMAISEHVVKVVDGLGAFCAVLAAILPSMLPHSGSQQAAAETIAEMPVASIPGK